MEFFEDLSSWNEGSNHALAVGFLEGDRPYSKGFVSEAFFERLIELVVDPWQPFASGGHHRCSLCAFSGGPGRVRYGQATVLVGSSLLFVPTVSTVYVAPSLVVHYVDAHQYLPPKEFREAVMTCPPMRSPDYLRLLLRNGIRKVKREAWG